jgi:hypothetical protein
LTRADPPYRDAAAKPYENTRTPIDGNTIATLVLSLVNSVDDGALSRNCQEANEVDADCADG